MDRISAAPFSQTSLPMQRIFTIAALLLVSCLTAKNPVTLHTIDQMNRTAEALNSHAGEEAHSVLEPVYDYMRLVPAEHLKTDGTAIYPRIKKMADGRYIMFCQGGQIASKIYYYTSDDLKTWSGGTLLFEPYPVVTSAGDDTRCFSTVDAVVLENGDILAACSYRASAGYKHNIDCGIMLRRSTDNGATWSDEEVIFEGTNWEPYLLQLPDGRVQCYFTDCLPKDRNSGTSVITSLDGGRTWAGHMRVCRQYKYDNNGVKIYTDQMPCFRLLNDGKTIFGFLEARVEPGGPQDKSKYMMSTVYNHGFDWKPLGENSEGPADRETNLFDGCAGYAAAFPSGETVVSCNIDRRFSMKVGDSRARVFNGRSWDSDWFQPFAGRGFWGSLEPLDDHHVIGTMHCDEGIQTGVFYLNHRIDAPRAKIKVDGDCSEWTGDQALFIGSDSPVQTIFRAACDDRYLYIAAERKDGAPAEDSTIEIYVSNGHADGVTVFAEVAPSGLVSCPVKGSGSGNAPVKGVKGACRDAVTERGETGWSAEAAIPLSVLGAAPGDTVCFNAVVKGEGLSDTFTFAEPSDPSTWMRIRLEKP